MSRGNPLLIWSSSADIVTAAAVRVVVVLTELWHHFCCCFVSQADWLCARISIVPVSDFKAKKGQILFQILWFPLRMGKCLGWMKQPLAELTFWPNSVFNNNVCWLFMCFKSLLSWVLGRVHTKLDKITNKVNGKTQLDALSCFIASSVTAEACRLTISSVSSDKSLKKYTWTFQATNSLNSQSSGRYHSMMYWRRTFRCVYHVKQFVVLKTSQWSKQIHKIK